MPLEDILGVRLTRGGCDPGGRLLPEEMYRQLEDLNSGCQCAGSLGLQEVRRVGVGMWSQKMGFTRRANSSQVREA